ncbi:MAG: hypothetical protein WB615_04800 [Candidatus Tumulicola sp.]
MRTGVELVFLVRMWVQGDEERADGDEWRGSVQEVDSGRRFYVTGMRDVADFIGARMAEKSQRRP